MPERLLDDLAATYRALLALYCDVEGGFAIRSPASRPEQAAALPEWNEPKTSEGREVAGQIKAFGEWLAAKLPDAHAALVDTAPKLIADLRIREHSLRFPVDGEPWAEGPFSTEPWMRVRIRSIDLSTAPHESLNDHFTPGKRRSDIVSLVLKEGIAEKLGFIHWLNDWDMVLREQWPGRAAAAPRVAVIAYGLGKRLTEALDDRRILIIDQDRGDFSETPEMAVRQKLAWDAGAPNRLALANVNRGPGLSGPPGSPPLGPPGGKDFSVDPAYEAFPAHVVKSEFDRWIWHLSQDKDSGVP
jgi:hypothetical protein